MITIKISVGYYSKVSKPIWDAFQANLKNCLTNLVVIFLNGC